MQAIRRLPQLRFLPLRLYRDVAAERTCQPAIRPAIGMQRQDHEFGGVQPDGFPDLVQKKFAIAFRVRRGKRLGAASHFDFIHICDARTLKILRKYELEALVETLHDCRA